MSKFKLPKIKHPWWHWFFTNYECHDTFGIFKPKWVLYHCSICKKDYYLEPIEIKYESEYVSENEIS